MITYSLHYIIVIKLIWINCISVTLHKWVSDASVCSAIFLSCPGLHYIIVIEFILNAFVSITLHKLCSNQCCNNFERRGYCNSCLPVGCVPADNLSTPTMRICLCQSFCIWRRSCVRQHLHGTMWVHPKEMPQWSKQSPPGSWRVPYVCRLE